MFVGGGHEHLCTGVYGGQKSIPNVFLSHSSLYFETESLIELGAC